MSRFAIRHVADLRADLDAVLDESMPHLRNARSVFIKPNVTYPRFREGVTTTPAVIEALVEALLDRSVERIVIGEGEGGYNSFSMAAALNSLGAEQWRTRYGVEVVVVTDWPSYPITVRNRHGSFTAHFPVALQEEFDALVTVPVPKVHAMTTISGAVKNQWGLVQDPFRLRLHLALPEILFAFHQTVQARVSALVDGTFGLTRNGPMIEGIPLPLGWLAGCDDVWAADVALAGIMGFNTRDIPYLRYALERGITPDSHAEDWADYRDDRFFLSLNIWNRAARLAWHSSRLNHLVYFSRASNVLHQVMYRVRRAPEDLAVRGRDWH